MVTRFNKSQDEDKPSKRFPLAGDFTSRPGTTPYKDQKIYNMYVSKEKDSFENKENYYLVSRPGNQREYVTSLVGEFRGGAFWGTSYYFVVGTKMYNYASGVLLNINAGAALFTTSTGPVDFCEHYDTTVGSTLVLTDGNRLWYLSASTTAVQVTDPQLPTLGMRTPVSMDGYLFIAYVTGGTILNSDLNNMTSWSSQAIRPELYVDSLVAIKKHNNQLIAFSSRSIEFFTDLGNTSSSPLGRTEGTSYQLGVPTPNAIASSERYIVFASQGGSSGRSVHMFDGFQLKKISTDAIEKELELEPNWNYTSFVGSGLFGSIIRMNGSLFYVLNTTYKTFVYSIETDTWAEWSSNIDGNHSKWIYWSFGVKDDGTIFTVNPQTNNIHTIASLYVIDYNVSIIHEIITRPFESETRSRKFLAGMYVVGNTPTTSTNLIVSWSDDDYQTWSSGVTVDLNKRPFIPRLGSFRKRAFRLVATPSEALKLEALEFTDMQTGHN